MKKNEQVEKILNLYYTFTSLKEVNRTGWRYWCVEGMRVESIADHTYGAIMLALSIYANTDLKLDINKVVMMLALHETEEIYIGDLTPFDKKARLTKAEDGKKAVERVFACADKKKYFLDIIAEFEAKSSPEAKFAHQIDKLEADLQALKYEGHFNLEKVNPNILNDERIVKIRNSKNTNKVSEYFLYTDLPLYSGITLDIANYVLKNSTTIKTKK